VTSLISRAARRAAERVQSLPRRRFYPWIPRWAEVRREIDVHPHVPSEHAEWFEAHNTGSTEFEVLNWLHATIRLLKPAAVLETGAADGLGTIALASACAANGRGVVHSVEIDPALCEQLRRRTAAEKLADHVRVHCESSLTYLASTSDTFDIGFFDSLCELRAQECRLCLERGLITTAAIFHDTSPHRTESLKEWPSPEAHAHYRADVLALARDPRCSGFFESTLSRGLIAIFVGVGARAGAA
jgi:predicted O-methyltransferase YrrM